MGSPTAASQDGEIIEAEEPMTMTPAEAMEAFGYTLTEMVERSKHALTLDVTRRYPGAIVAFLTTGTEPMVRIVLPGGHEITGHGPWLDAMRQVEVEMEEYEAS